MAHGPGHAPAHEPGHAPAPVHAEPAHKPKPPEHVKPVEPTKRGELTTLSRELTRRGKFIYDGVVSPLDVAGSDRRRLVDKAAEYRLGLKGYWSFIREHASDAFIYRSEGSKSEIDKLNDSLKQVDKDLASQLERWGELSNPYQDSYDVTRIKEVGKELSDVIRAAGMKLKGEMEVQRSAEADRRNAFRAEVALGLTGLAEQVGGQMDALGKGETIPNLSMANETIELMNRAAQDDSLTAFSKAVDKLQTNKDILGGFTADTLNKKLDEHDRLTREINLLKAGDPKIDALRKERDRVAEEVRPFYDVYKGERGGEGEVGELIGEFRSIDFSIRNLKDHPEDTPEQRSQKEKDRTARQAERRAVVEKLLPAMDAAVQRELDHNSTRMQEYQHLVSDSTDQFREDLTDFWSKTKKKVLDNIEAVAGKDKRKLLDKAFSTGGLADKVGDWVNILLKEANPKPDKMQSCASEVVKTADSYIGRIEGVLKDADSDAALRQLKEELITALTAIKFSTAEHLTFQFKLGRFN